MTWQGAAELLKLPHDPDAFGVAVRCPWCGGQHSGWLGPRGFTCRSEGCERNGRTTSLREAVDRISGSTRRADDSEAEGQTFVSLAELMERPELLEPPECVVPRIAYRGRLTLLAGPDKSGKSTLMARAMADLSRGRPFLGEAMGFRDRRVVDLGLEEALGDAVRRFAGFHADPERIQLVVLSPPDLLDRTRLLLAEWPADLVVLDSLSEYARITRGEVPENGDTAGWAAVIRPLVALARDSDCAVVVLHHTRKADGQYRGSTEIAAAADCLLELRTPERDEDPTVRHISGRARWKVEPFSVVLRDGRYELHGGGTLSLDARILLHVERNPRCSISSVRQAVTGKDATIVKTVHDLIARGALDNEGSDDRPILVRAEAAEGATC